MATRKKRSMCAGRTSDRCRKASKSCKWASGNKRSFCRKRTAKRRKGRRSRK